MEKCLSSQNKYVLQYPCFSTDIGRAPPFRGVRRCPGKETKVTASVHKKTHVPLSPCDVPLNAQRGWETRIHCLTAPREGA